jgi:hypothetical protein
MGRILGILVIVIGVWVGVEVYNEGVDGAFGGALAFLSDDGDGSGDLTTRMRVHDAVSSAHAEADARRERLLQE